MASQRGQHLPAGERMRRLGIAAWSIIGILLLGAILVWVLLKVRIIFPPLVLALLIIYLLNPIVNRLEARRMPRALAAVLTYIVILGGLTLVIVLLIPRISDQAHTFAEQWPEFRDKIVTFVDDTAESVNRRFNVHLDTDQFSCLIGADQTSGGPSEAKCNAITTRFRDEITHSAGRLTEIGFSILEGLLVFILAPLIALYLLIDLPQLRRDLLNLVPETSRAEFAELGTRVGKTLGGFFRGQLMVALIVGVLSALGFWLVHLPFWLVIGAIAGFFNLVPLIGPYIGGALGFLVGTVSGGVDLGIAAAIVELVVQQIDNHLITPNVMRKTVQLHPATVMLSLLAGGTLAGFWGVLLAVPGVATAKLLVGHFWATRVLGDERAVAAATAGGAEPPSIVPEEPVRASAAEAGDVPGDETEVPARDEQ